MRVAIIGAAGMLGRALTARLLSDGTLDGRPVESIAAIDVVAPDAVAGPVPLRASAADITAPGALDELIAARPDIIFDLAAVVSGEAERDLVTGYRVNLDGTRALFDALREACEADGYRPRLVFSSSIAVFGPPLPDVVGDEQALTPATSYGTQKAIAELLLADYSRRGLIDGIGIRLPTICVRPGVANQAATSFFSAIIREPLNGQPATLPVSRDVRHWFASPRAAVDYLVHAAGLDTEPLGLRRSLTMPGVSATVAEQIAALGRVGGERAVALIDEAPDELIGRMVDGWPRAFDARRAAALGFTGEPDFDAIVDVYVEDELGGAVDPRRSGS